MFKASPLSRRTFFQVSAAGSLAALSPGLFAGEGTGLKIATFQADATPPIGHGLCGGWIKPVEAVDDPLLALGIVILGAGEPIVLCAVDWCGVLNDANLAWRSALAQAVGTQPSRVALHTVHPHNAPFADTRAQEFLKEFPKAPQTMDVGFFQRVVEQSALAAKESLNRSRSITHVATGQAKVEQVASNRRLLGPDGKVAGWRGSACKDEKLRAEPEGLIDPFLKTLAFWDGDAALAALHYYAVHPMSYYGDGRVTPDFPGLARNKVQREHPETLHIYFTGCAGNIAAGKYNDGTPASRAALTARIYDGMAAAWKTLKKQPLETCAWRSEPVQLPPRADSDFLEETCRKVLADDTSPPARRGHAAFKLAYRTRAERPIDVGCLDLGAAQLLHLPAESFIEYQLHAQKRRHDGFVCTAAYGDDGPFYLPPAVAYPQGGYEVSVAFTAPSGEELLLAAIDRLL